MAMAVALSFAALACTGSIPSAPGITGSGTLTTIQSDLVDFDQLVVGFAFEATIRQGEAYSVVLTVDDNLADFVQVTKRGQTLEIGLDPDRAMNVRNATLRAEVTMPALTAVEASGASHLVFSGFAARDDLSATATGASSIRGEVLAGKATLEASGGSQITLQGEATDLVLDLSGASTADLEGFPADNIDATLGGASHAVVYASEHLDVEASGASRLTYVGTPTLGRVQTSGASTVEPK
jgi:hypothetical protein